MAIRRDDLLVTERGMPAFARLAAQAEGVHIALTRRVVTATSHLMTTEPSLGLYRLLQFRGVTQSYSPLVPSIVRHALTAPDPTLPLRLLGEFPFNDGPVLTHLVAAWSRILRVDEARVAQVEEWLGLPYELGPEWRLAGGIDALPEGEPVDGEALAQVRWCVSEMERLEPLIAEFNEDPVGTEQVVRSLTWEDTTAMDVLGLASEAILVSVLDRILSWFSDSNDFRVVRLIGQLSYPLQQKFLPLAAQRLVNEKFLGSEEETRELLTDLIRRRRVEPPWPY